MASNHNWKITNERFKERSCPGSLTYYLENKIPREKFETTLTYTNEERTIFFPQTFNFNFKQGKNPEEELNILGWEFDANKNKFFLLLANKAAEIKNISKIE